MNIKTYPLAFTAEKLAEIEETAGKRKIKAFIYQAIEEKLAIENEAKRLRKGINRG